MQVLCNTGKIFSLQTLEHLIQPYTVRLSLNHGDYIVNDSVTFEWSLMELNVVNEEPVSMPNAHAHCPAGTRRTHIKAR